MTVTTPETYHRDLPLTLLDAPQLDARIDRDAEQLEELERDIRRRGIIYDLIVVRVGERYEIVDGYTRFLCASRIPLAVVPCKIYPSKDAALEGVKYAANIFRLEMTPAEEAVMFGELLTHECEHDIERLCALVGKKLSYVDGRLALLHGGADVFEALRQKKIGVGVAQALNQVTDDKYRAHYLHHAIVSGATAAVVGTWVVEWRQILSGQTPAPPAAPPETPTYAEDVAHPFTCTVCGKHDRVHLIRQVNVHQDCHSAILEPLLKTYRGEA